MTKNARNCDTRRRYARVPVTGTVEYRFGASQGTADLRDAGLSGLSMAVDRKLLPGQRIMVEVTHSGNGFAEVTEMKGVVSWISPSEIDGEYVAGIRIYCIDEGTREAMGELVRAGFQIRREDALRRIAWGILPLRQGRRPEIIDTSNTWAARESAETPMKHTTAVAF